jgi:predicted Zn-dependent protease
MRRGLSRKVPRFGVLLVFMGLAARLGVAQDTADTTATPVSRPGTPAASVKEYHDGSVRDLNAIGNRKIGCDRGVGNWYSLEKQVAMGKAYAQQVESTAKLITDPVVTEYVNRIGQNIVRNSDARVPFTIKVIDSDDVNAFALPGGFFFVNAGLILAADDEAELAGVMAHETSHVAACHAAREQTRGTLANLASIPLIMVGGGIGYAAVEAVNVALPMSFFKFSRGFEAQADYLGLEYMYKAGYDPNAFLTFFEKVEAKEKQKPGTLAKIFETHPPTRDRMKAAQQEISTLLPPRSEYILDTSEFQDVKARLAAIENEPKLRTGKDAGQPTLRRAQQKPNDETQSGDDDRPMLKRRSGQDGPGAPTQ